MGIRVAVMQHLAQKGVQRIGWPHTDRRQPGTDTRQALKTLLSKQVHVWNHTVSTPVALTREITRCVTI